MARSPRFIVLLSLLFLAARAVAAPPLGTLHRRASPSAFPIYDVELAPPLFVETHENWHVVALRAGRDGLDVDGITDSSHATSYARIPWADLDAHRVQLSIAAAYRRPPTDPVSRGQPACAARGQNALPSDEAYNLVDAIRCLPIDRSTQMVASKHWLTFLETTTGRTRARVALPGDLEIIDVTRRGNTVLVGAATYAGARDGELVEPYRELYLYALPLPPTSAP